MMNRVLVVAPHPDDETLGCAGTLLKLLEQGGEAVWLLATSVLSEHGFGSEVINAKEEEIKKVKEAFGFLDVVRLHFPTTKVDLVATGELVRAIGSCFSRYEPDTVFIPFCNDVHTDHYHISKAALSCCKWFRYPFIKNVLFYETISETDFNINATEQAFRPNVYFDISEYYHKKLEVLKIYERELSDFPFPRSFEAIESLAKLRGSQVGVMYAEAFMLLRSVL